MPKPVHPRIAQLKAHVSPRLPSGPFSDLPYAQKQAAEQWYWKFCQRWGNDLPVWRRGILIGTARRLAKNPPAAGFGRSLFACRGANRLAARPGPHPGIVAMKRGREKRLLPSRQLPI
jgi:hypothetical protein